MTDIHNLVADVVRKDRGRLLAALIASLGDFALAEECLQEALISALEHWGARGLPRSPQGWILQVARRRAIDRLRRDRNFKAKAEQIAYLIEQDEISAASIVPPDIPDERLRLIFACCHPALDTKTRVALTLRTLGGLTTLEVARAFLDRETTMGQRLSRARNKISKAGIPLAVPGPELWAERLGSVLTVIYLIFNEGYSATAGADPLRVDLCEEALFLARLMNELQPEEPEIEGLLALILLAHSRRAGRQYQGRFVPLDEQDRTLWDSAQIAEGTAVLTRALRRGLDGPFQIQAAISAVHCEATTASQTGWAEISGLYARLRLHDDGAVVRLNEIVARSYLEGPAFALNDLSMLAAELTEYQPFHAARADLLRRLGDWQGAAVAYECALALTWVNSEAEFLQARMDRMIEMGKKKAETSSA